MKMDFNKNIYKFISVSIIAFWLVMMGILISRNVIFTNRVKDYQPFLSKDTLLSDQWMGIYFNNASVGFVHTSIEPFQIKAGVSGFRIVNRTNMNFLLLRKRQKVWFGAEAIVDEDYQMRSFDFNLRSGAHSMNVKGVVTGGSVMNLEIDSQGRVIKKQIILPQREGVILANIISPFSSFGKLSVGAHYKLQVFNPFSLELEPLEIVVSGKDEIEYAGKLTEVFVVKSDYRGYEQTAWINAQGEVLKEETALGWILVKESPDTASKMFSSFSKTDLELADFVSIVPNVLLENPDADYLKVSVSGIGDDFNLESSRQKILETTEDNKKVLEIIRQTMDITQALPLPVTEYPDLLKGSEFLQIDDENIKKTAQKIIGKETNSFVAARMINTWVYNNIRKVPVVSIPSALDVLMTREGDCNEHTILFTALARAVGIPAQINVGLTYTGGRFYYHAWPSVYVGKWIEMDPTFGQDFVDVSHIKLLEGDLNKQLDIIKLIGKISVEVIEYR
ncbi:MAG: transglutaminase-like domain-containing protein [Candidatus Omnitrophota bacterium]